MRPLQIGISPGDIAYNRGDEAIVLAMITELRRRGHHVAVVFSRDPTRTEKRLGVPSQSISPISFVGSRFLRNIDLLLWGCGQLINDRRSIMLLPYFACRAWQALHRRIPVMLFAAGVGELKHRFSKALAQSLVDGCRFCSVRDEQSRTILRACGVNSKVAVFADPAFLVSSRVPRVLPMKTGVVFAVREWFLADYNLLPRALTSQLGFSSSTPRSRALIDLYASVADQLIESGIDVSFVAMSTAPGHNDLVTAREIVGKMRRHAHIFEEDLTVPDLLQIFARARAVVATRMHAAILALAAGSRPILLTYEAKGEALVERTGLQEWSLPIEKATPSLLIDKIRRVLIADDAVDQYFREASDRMRHEAESTFDVVDELAREILGQCERF